MSNNLATRFGDLSLRKLPALSRKANPDSNSGSTSTAATFEGRAFSLWHNLGSAISNFEVAWTVPNAPTTDDGQEISLFSSLGWSRVDANRENVSANLRPVLRWVPATASVAASWTVTSWYIGQDSTSSTAPVTVKQGDAIKGKITLMENTQYNYKCFFTKPDPNDATKDIDIPGTELYVFGGTAYDTVVVGFEWANLQTTSDFVSNNIAASSIVIATGATNPAVRWKLITFQTTTNGGDPVKVKVDDTSSTVTFVPPS